MSDTDSADSAATATKGRAGGVQSIERAFGLLETMADAGGMMGLSQLATASGLPLPTIHRLVRTLVDLGYLRQEPNRQYVLGPKLIRLGESSSHMLSTWARPHLARLVDELGESSNLAMLDGDQIVYVAQAQSRQSMRMFTEVGRRVSPHCTAVGKAILAGMAPEQVRDILKRTDMVRHTDTTIRARRLPRAARVGRGARLRPRRGRAGRGRALRRRHRAGLRLTAGDLRQRADRADERRAGRPGGAAPDRGRQAAGCRPRLSALFGCRLRPASRRR